MPTAIHLLERCFYNLRAGKRIFFKGPDAPTPEEKVSLRDCLYSCNGVDSCSGPNLHNSHSDSNNPLSEGALPNFCNGYISIGDVQSGKCIWKIKAQELDKRKESLNEYSHCLSCENCFPTNNKECYEDVREFIQVEEIFRV